MPQSRESYQAMNQAYDDHKTAMENVTWAKVDGADQDTIDRLERESNEAVRRLNAAMVKP